MSHSKPRYRVHDGFRMPMGFPVDGFRSALRYQARAGDIFVTAYPKCGTTWAQHILYLILHDGEPLAADKRMTDEIPHLEEVGCAVVEALAPPRCIKTHLPFQMTPYHPEARYLYIARNPFDCAVSFYHHTRGFPQHYDFADGRFEDFFECFIAGEVDFGGYFDNLVSWYAHKDDENVLFTTYEEMKTDPAGSVVRIGEFLGPRAAGTVHEGRALAGILEHSSFEAMRRNQQRWSSKRPDDMPAFVRKGEIGDWRNHFSAEQARRLARAFDESTRGTGLQTLWPDVLAAARCPAGRAARHHPGHS